MNAQAIDMAARKGRVNGAAFGRGMSALPHPLYLLPLPHGGSQRAVAAGDTGSII